MFDLGWSEMLVVGAVALLVIGPKDLPAALRQAGKWMGAVRRMASDFQGQVNQAMKEAELDGLRREVDSLKSGIDAAADPVRSAGGEVKALVEKPAALPKPDPKAAAPAESLAPSRAPDAADQAPSSSTEPETASKPRRSPRRKSEVKS